MSTAGNSTAIADDSTVENPTAGKSSAANSYEVFKQSLKQAEAAGDAAWAPESSEPTTGSVLGNVELKGLGSAVLLGLGFLIAAGVLLLLNFSHLTRGERTVGVVVGHKDYYNRRSCTVHAPVVNYSAPGGVYKVIGCLSVSRSIYPVGKEVPVLYLRDDPSNAVVADFVQMFLIPTVVGSLGLLCLTVSIGVMIWAVRKGSYGLLAG